MMRSRGRHHVKAVGFSKDRNENVFAALRIGVGIFFLVFGEYKVFGTQFTLGRGFQAWINRLLAHGACPFVVRVLWSFVLPHAPAIAFLVAYREFAIGVTPAVGVHTHTASFWGGLLRVAMIFSSDSPGAGAVF